MYTSFKVTSNHNNKESCYSKSSQWSTWFYLCKEQVNNCHQFFYIKIINATMMLDENHCSLKLILFISVTYHNKPPVLFWTYNLKIKLDTTYNNHALSWREIILYFLIDLYLVAAMKINGLHNFVQATIAHFDDHSLDHWCILTDFFILFYLIQTCFFMLNVSLLSAGSKNKSVKARTHTHIPNSLETLGMLDFNTISIPARSGLAWSWIKFPRC